MPRPFPSFSPSQNSIFMLIFREMEKMEDFPGQMAAPTMLIGADEIWSLAEQKGFLRENFVESINILLERNFLRGVHEVGEGDLPGLIGISELGYSQYLRSLTRRER